MQEGSCPTLQWLFFHKIDKDGLFTKTVIYSKVTSITKKKANRNFSEAKAETFKLLV